MSTFSKKVAAVVLTATTVLSLSGVGSFVGVAGAQTMDINALLAQIAALQAQLMAIQGGGSMTAACSITSDLQVGSRGATVTCLQNALISAGHLAAGLNTGYFGGLTKAAVMKWQAANGVSATGYFGPVSRAKWTAMMGTVTPPVGGGTTPPPVINPTGSLWVAADTSGSMGSSIIAGAGQVKTLGISFTAPATTGVTVTGLTFTKTGVLSDGSVNNMYLADSVNGNVVAQFQSLSSGVATFSGLNLNVAAGQTWRGELRIDVATGAGSGNTIAFDMTGVTTANNVTVAGLPVRGSSLTVTTVTNPALAGATYTFNAVGSAVNAGTNNVLISDATVAITSSPVDLKSITFALVGSANKADIRNLMLKVNGQTVATAPVGADSLVFSMAGAPVRLQTGNSNVSLYADIAGSPNRTVQATILRPYDLVFTDTQYQQNLTASVVIGTCNGVSCATPISIRTGSITVTAATDSPSNPIPVGASSVPLAKINVYAAGEPVKIKWLDVTLTQRTSPSEAWTTTASTFTDDVSNLRVISNDGRQLGNSISTLSSGTDSGTCTVTDTTVLTCHFGTSSSNINFVIPANTTATFTIISDIGSSADINTLAAAFAPLTGNLEGQVSFQSADSGTATGAARQVNNNPLTVAKNPSLSVPVYISGASSVRIASFVLTASSAQSATLRSVTIDRDATAGLVLQNLKAMVGATQFGQTQNTVGATETGITFSGSDIVVPAGGSTVIDIYADIVSSSAAGTYTSPIDFNGWSATGGISGSSIAFTSAQDGTNITLSAGPSIVLSAGSNTAPAQNLVMGSSNNEVFTLRIANDNVDQVRITDVTIYDTITSGSAGKASFDQFTLWDGSTQVAGPVSPTSVSATTSTIAFSLSGSGAIIEKNASKSFVVKAAVPSISSGGAVSGSSHLFRVYANSDVIAKSVGSPSATVTITGTTNGTVVGNAQSVYQTKLSVASQLFPGTAASNRSRTATDDLALMTFSADSAQQLTLSSIALTFTGMAITTGTQAFAVNFIDDNTNLPLGASASNVTCTPVNATCNAVFLPAYVISAGDSKKVRVRVASSLFTNAASAPDGLSVTVSAAANLHWNDGVTALIGMESRVIPLTVVSVSYD